MRMQLLRYLHKRSGRCQGERLAPLVLVLNQLLFPINGMLWALAEFQDGYRPETDTWCINGVHYAAESLALLAQSKGSMYKVTRVDNTIVLEYRGKVL